MMQESNGKATNRQTPRWGNPVSRGVLLLGMLLAVQFIPARAAVVIENVSSDTGIAAEFSHQHECSGSERLLVIAVASQSGTAVDSVTYANKSLEKKRDVRHTSGGPRLSVWSLTDPPVGTWDVVVKLASGIADSTAITVVSYGGVDQSTPVDHFASMQDINADPAIVVTSEKGNLVQDFMASLAVGQPEAGADQLQRWSAEMGGPGITGHFAASSTELGSNAVDMRWSLDESGKAWVIIGMNINATKSPSSYYVSPDGDDSQDGLKPDRAWASIDRGEQLDIMRPGDTVNLLPGAYYPADKLELATDGTASSPIVYRSYGQAPAILDGAGQDFELIHLKGLHTYVEGLELKDARKPGIVVDADSCRVTRCNVHDIDDHAIEIKRHYCLAFGNILARVAKNGIENTGDYTNSYQNTVYDCGEYGIDYNGVHSGRIFNNIVVGSDEAIRGKVDVVCGFNLAWDNIEDYTDGVVDSAGGIAADPLFADTMSSDFRLRLGSPAIDNGLDLGYPFAGIGPDMGALEAAVPGEIVITTLYDSLIADQTYPFSAIVLDSDGDTLDCCEVAWNHTFPTGSIDSTGVFTPELVGAGEIVASLPAFSLITSTPTLEVVPGALDTLVVSPMSATISADSTKQFTAAGQDVHGNAVADMGTLTWSVNGQIGTISQAGLFDATTVGSGTVHVASDLGNATTTDSIIVQAGSLAMISVDPRETTIMVAGTKQYSAAGFDADSNLIGLLTDSVAWSTTDAGGNISSSGLYTAGSAGEYLVVGDFLAFSDSALVHVSSNVSYVKIELPDGTELGDTSLTTDNDTTRLYCRAYDAVDSLVGLVDANWTLIGGDSIGALLPARGPSTLLEVRRPGTGRITAQPDEGSADSTGTITVSSGLPDELSVSPDSAVITADSSQQFFVLAADADGNPTAAGGVAWEVLGGVGTIDGTGLFTPTASGIGRIVATSIASGAVDTTTAVVVVPGVAVQLQVAPENIDIGLGDSVQFTATGLDSKGNIADAGSVTWGLLGRVGSIDASGLFIADEPGGGKVVASSDIGLTDTSGIINVEELVLSTIAIGSSSIHAGETFTALAFHLHNYYSEPKEITRISVRQASHGVGTLTDQMDNVDSLALYLDLDGDSLYSPADSLLSAHNFGSQTVLLDIDPLPIEPDEGWNILVRVKVSAQPCDGDSIDVKIITGSDVQVVGGTNVIGPAVANSIGYGIVDGMLAEQISRPVRDDATVGPADTLVPLLSIGLPRNGYLADTLTGLSIVNFGTAAVSDIDSLVLYIDEGDGVWSRAALERHSGQLVFTGSYWTRTGMSIPLAEEITWLHVAGDISDYPTNGATLAFGVPEGGISVKSGNDGPLDQPLTHGGEITIASDESLALEAICYDGVDLVPGELSPPLIGWRLRNTTASEITIDSFVVSVLAEDPRGAVPLQLDSQFDSLLLALQPAESASKVDELDSVIASAFVADGLAVFHFDDLTVAGFGSSVTLTLGAQLSEDKARDGNTVRAGIAAESDVFVSPPISTSGSFPVECDDEFTIRTFQVSALNVDSTGARSLFGGQTDEPVLSLLLPGNGYASDVLQSVSIENTGTLDDAVAISTMKLWLDKGNDGFSDDDQPVGSLTYSGGIWRLTGLNTAIPPGGKRAIITVDIDDDLATGGTFRPAVPKGGIVYRSGMDGPDDAALLSAESFIVFPSDRITAVSIPSATIPVHPAASGVPALTFALYNGYVDAGKTLASVQLSNRSHSRSGPEYADYELGQVTLYLDADRNRSLSNDSLISSGVLVDGEVTFSGLNTFLPPESLSYFFVTVDLPPSCIDSDSLGLEISAPSDLVFTTQVNINGDLPITGGGWLVVDGSVSDQYEILPQSPQTLAPGDSNATLMSLHLASNGNLTDTLASFSVVNLRSADETDLQALELWLDMDDDDIWQVTDSLVGTFTYGGSEWQLAGLSLPVSDSTATLFVQVDIDSLATPDAAVQLAVPIDGCQFASANDGPTDVAISSASVFTISSSALKLTHAALAETHSITQPIVVELQVSNLLGTAVDSVVGEIVAISDSSLVQLDSSQAGPITLAGGETRSLTYYYSALSPGTVTFDGLAYSTSSLDSSAVIQTSPVLLQSTPTDVPVHLINSIPTSAVRGQTNVFPFSLVIDHPDSVATSASMRLDSLRISVFDGGGAPIPADAVFSRIVIAGDFKNIAVLQSIPSTSEVLLSFTEPIYIEPGEVQRFSLLADISASATADEFVLRLEAAASIPIVDRNTLQAVTISPSTGFPLSTAACRIEDPSSELAISVGSYGGGPANYGQDDVVALSLRLFHPGGPGSSRVQLTDVLLQVLDSTGTAITPSQAVDRISVKRSIDLLGSLSGSGLELMTPRVQLTSPLNIDPEETASIDVLFSISPVATESEARAIIADSAQLVVRDASSGSLLDAVTDTLLLSTGSVFPIVSDPIGFVYPAQPPELCLTALTPAGTAAGADSVALMSMNLDYGADSGHAPVSVKTITLTVSDSLGNPLDPERLFDRLGYRRDGGTIVYATNPTYLGDRVTVTIDGFLVNPTENAALTLVADIEGDVPYNDFTLSLEQSADVDLRDGVDTSSTVDYLFPGSCTASLPWSAGTAIIYRAAGRPLFSNRSAPTLLVHSGQSGATPLEADFTYESEQPLGDLRFDGLTLKTLRRSGSSWQAVDAASLFDTVRLVIDDATVAVDSLPAGDSVALQLPAEFVVSSGFAGRIVVQANIRSDVLPGNYLLSIGDSTAIGVADRNLLTPVYPVLSGAVYPVTSSVISVSAPSLEASFSNYPNPFIPTRDGATTFGYVLPADAMVDIELFTITGEAVREVARDAFRAAGSHQEDTWSGINDVGQPVVPGTYFCRITARFVGGGSETVRRKVAVVR